MPIIKYIHIIKLIFLNFIKDFIYNNLYIKLKFNKTTLVTKLLKLQQNFFFDLN